MYLTYGKNMNYIVAGGQTVIDWKYGSNSSLFPVHVHFVM